MLYQIEVTTHCNFQCFYCAGRDMPQRHMEWDLFESILAGIPSGPHLISLQGEGEPTIHPRFWEMVEAVRARGLTPYTITNGSYGSPERFAEAFPRIGESIDTLDPIEANRIGRYKLDRVLRNLDELNAHMGSGRIHIMTVDYGQSLDAVREFVRTRGFSHGVQPLQPKADYARRYRDRLEAPPPKYTYRCRFLEQPLRRFYDIKGREYPCCYIKDARWHEPVETMQAKMAAHQLPAACKGCGEVLTPESLPRPRVMAPATDVPLISFITTCKGRLAHLKQSLPPLKAQPQAEVIVVDYDCPDGAGAWVAENFPGVKLVAVNHAPIFNISRARNAGAAQARGKWLCFVDADALLDTGFVAQALPLLRESTFYLTSSPRADAFGTVICSRDDFFAIEGYDEVMQGWGSEDRDFYIRLGLLGRTRQMLQDAQIKTIAHDVETRVRHYEIKDRWLNQRINALYVQIKHDLARQIGKTNLPPELRRTIYAEVRGALQRAAKSGQPAARVEVTLPADLVVRLYGWQMKRVWTYLLEPVLQPATPGIVAGGMAGQHSAAAAGDKGAVSGQP